MLKKSLYYAVLLVIVLLGIGTVYYSLTEGWSLVDAFYFSTMTLTTIGYGDLAPSTDGAKIFTSFYALFGIGIMLYILSSVIGVFVFKQEGRFGRFFSFVGKIRRHEKKIQAQEKELTQQEKEIKKTEKAIKKLKKKIKK